MRNKLVTAILTVLMLLLVVPSKALAATGDSGLPYYVKKYHGIPEGEKAARASESVSFAHTLPEKEACCC